MTILRIKEILDEKQISIKEFAELTGLSYTYSTEVIRNVKFPRKETLLDIADKLEVDIKDLFHSTKSNRSKVEILNEAKRLIDIAINDEQQTEV